LFVLDSGLRRQLPLGPRSRSSSQTRCGSPWA